jgi:hypothetical protein
VFSPDSLTDDEPGGIAAHVGFYVEEADFELTVRQMARLCMMVEMPF